jgi:hypothetical protein
MSETEPLYAIFDRGDPPTPRGSRPGDVNRWEGIGTVELVGLPRGSLRAFLLNVQDGHGEVLRIVVWPPVGSALQVQPGDRVLVRGSLRVEGVERRALHYVQARWLEVL